MSDRLILELPMAPTVNHHYATILMGKKPRRIVSRDGVEWRDHVASKVLAENIPKCVGIVRITGLLFFPTAAGDVDNRVKPTLDALEFAGVIENDKRCHRVDFRRAGSRTRPGRMLIRISRFEPELPDAYDHWKRVLETEEV